MLTKEWWAETLSYILEKHSPCLLDEEMKKYKGMTRAQSTALLERQLEEFEQAGKRFLSTARWCQCYQEPILKYGNDDGGLMVKYCDYIRQHIAYCREMGDEFVKFIKEHTRR